MPENAKLPTSSLPTESGSGNCLGHLYQFWFENDYFCNSAGAKSALISKKESACILLGLCRNDVAFSSETWESQKCDGFVFLGVWFVFGFVF